MKWPTLPHITVKAVSFFLFLVTMLFKILDVKSLFSVFDAPCIAGWEVSDEVGNHILMLSLTIVSDIVFVIVIGIAFLMPSSNFGADPKAIAYNIFGGLITFGSLIKISKLGDCQNEAMQVIKSAPFYALVAGFIHIVNGVLCIAVLAPSERRLPFSKKPTPPPTE